MPGGTEGMKSGLIKAAGSKEPAVCQFGYSICIEEYYFFATYFLISKEIAM
jgi:hypothetical protein